jgi:hypothetical protein
MVDCGDPDCAGQTFCIPSVEDCHNDWDDDFDGLTDCLDADCSGGPDCSEICDNGRDDDVDGETDCTDTDCGAFRPCAALFVRGDVDGNSRISVIDAIFSVPVGDVRAPRDCADAQDADDDGRLTVLDAITLITYLFRHGPELAAPYVACGTDPTPDPLPCMDAPCP